MTAKKSTANKTDKETVYIDVDDEITNIIDKVKQSDSKIVALVLPKRSTVLQSVVNMKLLKKAGQTAKKNIVLITSETALLPLAGAAGLHVAKSLQSKPVIPPLPSSIEKEDEIDAEEELDEPQLDKTAPVGALAAADAQDDDEVIELDNSAISELPADTTRPKKPKKLRALKVPNFDRFRVGVVLGAVAFVLLIIGWVFAAKVMPKAIITIKTDTSTVVSSFDFTASRDQQELDLEGNKIPAQLKELKKTDTEKAAATGEKNNGEAATGSVVLRASDCTPPFTAPSAVPAGSTVSSGGKNYILEETLTFALDSADSCVNYKTGSGDITAGAKGAGYNLPSGSEFTVLGRSGISGTGSASGGTDDIVKVVTQKDIDDAVARISERQSTSIGDELKTMFEAEDLFALTETLSPGGDPKVKATPEVDKEAKEFTVSWEAVYTMLGIKRSDLTEVIKKDIEGEIDTGRQAITDDGIDKAIIRVNNNATPGSAFMNFRASVTAGPQIDEEAIKNEAKGKKRGEVEKYISSLPGVDDVIVDYSPFWVYSTPGSTGKITIKIEKSE